MLARVTPLFFFAPLFSSKLVPARVRAIVAVALAIGIVTFIAARNLPGVLEITALHRLRIEAGTRYAISAVSRYLIAVVGVIFAFRSIGFDWSQVQWIVAALAGPCLAVTVGPVTALVLA